MYVLLQYSIYCQFEHVRMLKVWSCTRKGSEAQGEREAASGKSWRLLPNRFLVKNKASSYGTKFPFRIRRTLVVLP